jgi:hypothetical protein
VYYSKFLRVIHESRVGNLRVTHPSAKETEIPFRLACVKPAASVRSEPGSNSSIIFESLKDSFSLSKFVWLFYEICYLLINDRCNATLWLVALYFMENKIYLVSNYSDSVGIFYCYKILTLFRQPHESICLPDVCQSFF